MTAEKKIILLGRLAAKCRLLACKHPSESMHWAALAEMWADRQRRVLERLVNVAELEEWYAKQL